MEKTPVPVLLDALIKGGKVDAFVRSGRLYFFILVAKKLLSWLTTSWFPNLHFPHALGLKPYVLSKKLVIKHLVISWFTRFQFYFQPLDFSCRPA